MSVKLFCMANQDRSDRVRWLLEELKVPYKNHYLKRKYGELRTPEYLALNSMSRVPTIVDGDLVIHESAAICLYLADKYREHSQLAPDIHSPDRALYLQWMVYSVASLECVVAKMFTLGGKSEEEQLQIKNFVKDQCEILKKPLIQTLSQHPYILASGYSAADIMLACVIPGAWEYLVENEPVLKEYMERMMKNPIALKTKVFETPDMTDH